jgi:hypothetical protein
VIRQRRVAIFAGIVQTATLHLDRNNIARPVIVFAAGLGVEIDATHFWKIGIHRGCRENILKRYPMVSSSS